MRAIRNVICMSWNRAESFSLLYYIARFTQSGFTCLRKHRCFEFESPLILFLLNLFYEGTHEEKKRKWWTIISQNRKPFKSYVTSLTGFEFIRLHRPKPPNLGKEISMVFFSLIKIKKPFLSTVILNHFKFIHVKSTWGYSMSEKSKRTHWS